MQQLLWSVAYSPDGTHIVSGSDDNSVRIWNIADNLKKVLEHGVQLY